MLKINILFIFKLSYILLNSDDESEIEKHVVIKLTKINKKNK